MGQAERSRFKHTVIATSFTRAPEQARLDPVPVPEPEVVEAQATLVRVNGAARPASLALRSESAHFVVVEEVALSFDPDPRLAMLDATASKQARAYRLLRHWLLSHTDPRVIAVASAEPGEGKSTCAANLALAMADETFARVLLIEANLRRPAFAELFRYAPRPSFMDKVVRQRDATPPYRVAAVAGTRLHLAALAGETAPGARLDRLLLDVVLRDLRSAYDYIVIDAAAVLESADAHVAGECADGVILVTRSRQSRLGALERAIVELRPSTVFGSVVLDV